MLDATFPSRGSNGPEYHRVVVKAKVRQQVGFTFINSRSMNKWKDSLAFLSRQHIP